MHNRAPVLGVKPLEPVDNFSNQYCLNMAYYSCSNYPCSKMNLAISIVVLLAIRGVSTCSFKLK